MGYTRHHAIIVTSYDRKKLERARRKAKSIFKEHLHPDDEVHLKKLIPISNIVESSINGWYSFFIAPDGSKERWIESKRGDLARKELVQWIDSQKYEDNSSPLSFVEVFYGDDNGRCEVVKYN